MATPGFKYRQFARDNASAFGPEELARTINSLMLYLQRSPAYASLLENAGLAGSQASTNLERRLARSGLGGSGVGDIAGAVGQSLPTQMRSDAILQLFQMASQLGQQNLGQRATMSSYFANNLDWRSGWEKVLPALLSGAALASGNPAIAGAVRGGGLKAFGGGQQATPAQAWTALQGAGRLP